jgi:hypothetical protein
MPTSARAAFSCLTSTPLILIRLLSSKLSSKLMQRIKVDLPEPDGPTTHHLALIDIQVDAA